ncbi:hypothetical protein F5X99DRAFT_380041 [Biscogniauxia marginata]|nr:hypothetical protein F5X99DRAFT_380041 [Biscogniauxia marginata]
MQKRRSHKKSRRGCINCKKWHTKCDELGPPCTNCSLRNATCEYAWSLRDKSLALAPRKAESTGSSDDGRSVTKSVTPDIVEPRRVLELELMHQWSTSTYQSFASIPEDYHYLQVVLPREALRCDYLLNGILTAAALHMATKVEETEARMYINTAMELYDKASSSFRTQLSNITRDNHHLLYMFSAMTAFINMTFAQCAFRDGDELSILSSVAVAFDLLNGSLSIALTDFKALLDSPIPLRTFLSLGEASVDILDAGTRAALARLAELNDRYTSALADDATENVGGEAPPATTLSPYTGAISFLERCFAEDARGVFRGYCCAFPSACGHQFAAAIKDSEPMVLLILMHWTVLLDRIDEEYWWAKNLGKRLAVGISEVLLRSHPTLIPEWRDNISWVRQQICLPDVD